MVRFICLKMLLYNLFSKGTRFDVLTPRIWTWNERSCWCTVTAVVGHKSWQTIFFLFFLLLSVFSSVFVGLGKTLPSLVLDDKLLETLRQLSRAWITTRNTSARSLKLWLTRSNKISLRRRYTATLVSGLDRVCLFFWSLWRRRTFCQTVWVDIVVLFFPRRLLCYSNCFSFAVDFYIFD